MRTFNMTAPAAWPLKQLCISVLTFQSGGEWQTIALQMDLSATGATADQARAALADSVLAQISFAVQKGQPDLLFKDAAPVYWQMFNSNRRREQEAMLLQQDIEDTSAYADDLQIPPALIAQYQRKKPFKKLSVAA